MNYEQKYNKLVEAVKVLQETNPSDEGIQNWVNENVPELAESEDEMVRKEIISLVLKVMGREKDNLNDKNYNKMLDWLENHKHIEKQTYWTKLDEKRAKEIIYALQRIAIEHDTYFNEAIMWLESLKERVQPKQEWSEEDEVFLRRAINAAKDAYPVTAKWLESLKQRIGE